MVFFECKTGGPEQASIVATLGSLDLYTRGKERKGTLLDLLVHVFRKQIPSIHNPTANDNHFRIQNVDEIRQPNAKVNTHPPEDLER